MTATKTAAELWRDRCSTVAAESKDLAAEILDYLQDIDELTAIDALLRAMNGVIIASWPPETQGQALEHYIRNIRKHFAEAAVIVNRNRT